MNFSETTYSTTPFLKFVWCLVLSAALYFVMTRAVNYFTLTPESYTPYFWSRVNWVLPHVISGIVTILLGPLLFFLPPAGRAHKRVFWVYSIAVLIGSVCAVYLSITSQVSTLYASGLLGLTVAWVFATAMMLYKFAQAFAYRAWLRRSYIVTFSFVLFWSGVKLLELLDVGDPFSRMAIMSWLCWLVPLLVVEVYCYFIRRS